MVRIPTLFERTFENHRVVSISPKPVGNLGNIIEEDGCIATEMMDGTTCAVIGGRLYRRFDAKGGKSIPQGAIQCCPPDPVTGHWPHWVPVRRNDASAKWILYAYMNTEGGMALEDGTYEAVGPHFQGNPYGLEKDIMVRHGEREVVVPRDFDGLRKWLSCHMVKGIVFWKDGKPVCKIKRSDFGLPWGADTARGGTGAPGAGSSLHRAARF